MRARTQHCKRCAYYSRLVSKLHLLRLRWNMLGGTRRRYSALASNVLTLLTTRIGRLCSTPEAPNSTSCTACGSKSWSKSLTACGLEYHTPRFSLIPRICTSYASFGRLDLGRAVTIQWPTTTLSKLKA